MKIITVINAKGGCGKSTIATSVAVALAKQGYSTLLIDMDPQAQVTQWFNAGDGLKNEGTLVQAMAGAATLQETIQPTHIPNLSFIASAIRLEDLGHRMMEIDGYQTILTHLLADLGNEAFGALVIDSPNQISPIMENAIFPADLFIVPFESTKAVRSYANVYKLFMRLRPDEDYEVLHVLSNLTRQKGLRADVISLMEQDGIRQARTEVRSCGWLARIDEHGGSIFDYRPHCRGAADITALSNEAVERLSKEVPTAIAS